MLKNFYYIFGRIFEKFKKYNYAIKFYSIASNRNINSAIYRLAYCNEKIGNLGDAIYFYKKSISNRPNKDNWYYNLARSLIKLKKYNDAKFYLEKALVLNSNNSKYIDLYKKHYFKNNLPIEPTILFNNYKVINKLLKIDSFVLLDIKEDCNNKLKLQLIGKFTDTLQLNSCKLQIYLKKNIEDNNYKEIENSNIINIDKNLYIIDFLVCINELIKKDTIDSIWDFYLYANSNLYRVSTYRYKFDIINYKSYSIIPYATKYNGFSIMSILSNKDYKSNKSDIVIVITKLNSNSRYVFRAIKLANYLAKHTIKVTLLILDLRAVLSKYYIEPTVNIEYISVAMYRNNKNSLKLKDSIDNLPDEFINNFSLYLQNKKTKLIYIPIYTKEFFSFVSSFINNSKSLIIYDNINICNIQEKNYEFKNILYNYANKISFIHLPSTKTCTVINFVNTVHNSLESKSEVKELGDYIINKVNGK